MYVCMYVCMYVYIRVRVRNEFRVFRSGSNQTRSWPENYSGLKTNFYPKPYNLDLVKHNPLGTS